MLRKTFLVAALALAAAGPALANPPAGRPAPDMMNAAFGLGPVAGQGPAFDLVLQADGSLRVVESARRRADFATGGTPVIVNEGDGTFHTTYRR